MANKKFFDIYPPKKLKEKKEEQGLNAFLKQPKEKKFFFSGRWVVVFVLILLFLVTGSVLSYFTLLKAEIDIWPKTQILNFDEEIVASTQVPQDDPTFWAENSMIPAKIVEKEQSISQQFSSSGKVLKEANAKGQIRIYNAYSTSSQVLVANTRFISSEGKLFRSTYRITIPGAKYEKGKLQPSYIDAEVQAAESGESYNIGPSTFSIPGFAGTAKYTAFYGKSFSSMVGGFKSEVAQVTKEDLDNAEKVLLAKLTEESKNSLRSSIGSDYILLDEAIKKDIVEASSLVTAGAQADAFNFQVKIKIQALVFSKNDLEALAKNFILAQVPAGRKIQETSLEMSYSGGKGDFESKKITLNTKFSAKVYQDVDEQALLKELVGKSVNEAQVFLESQPQISKIQIELRPFWVKRVPKNIDKVKINLNL